MLALGLAGCGSDDDAEPTSSATAATPAPPTAAQPASPYTSSTVDTLTSTGSAPVTTSPESATGGAGDEEAIRQPAAFTIRAGSLLKPARITVLPQLPVEVTVTNKDSVAHVLEVNRQGPLSLAPGAAQTVKLEGLKPGNYSVSIDDGAQAATLTAADDAVGP